MFFPQFFFSKKNCCFLYYFIAKILQMKQKEKKLHEKFACQDKTIRRTIVKNNNNFNEK
jgi:hypothetical protein